jgi:hypothetical protein
VTVNDHRAEVIGTILLSIAALCTSWAGYQATLWSGEQSQHSAEAGALRNKSSRSSNIAGQFLLLDVALFNNWLEHRVRGESQLAEFIEARFRPEFKPAFDAWMRTSPFEAPSASASPFSMPVYHLRMLDSAEMYETRADSAAARSNDANLTSDRYVLAAVILATVMFFATAAQQTDPRPARWLLLGLASLASVVGVVRLLTLPRA